MLASQPIDLSPLGWTIPGMLSGATASTIWGNWREQVALDEGSAAVLQRWVSLPPFRSQAAMTVLP